MRGGWWNSPWRTPIAALASAVGCTTPCWAAQPCPRALLCTGVANEQARAMYERRGWYYVHPAFDFPGQPHPYAIMGKELRAPGVSAAAARR